MNIITKYGSKIRSVAFFCFAIVALTLFGTSSAFAQEPSNKTSAVIMRNDIVFAVPQDAVLLAEEHVKTSKPTDLMLSFTAESSIVTNVMTTGSQTQSAEGKLEVYIVIDDNILTQPAPAPVGPGNPTHGDTAAVVFANQIYSRTTNLGSDDTTDTVNTYLETKHATGFNWMAFNIGSGLHRIQVFARYTETETTAPTTFARGVIGNRSLVVQPVKSAVRETVTLN